MPRFVSHEPVYCILRTELLVRETRTTAREINIKRILFFVAAEAHTAKARRRKVSLRDLSGFGPSRTSCLCVFAVNPMPRFVSHEPVYCILRTELLVRETRTTARGPSRTSCLCVFAVNSAIKKPKSC